MKNASRSIRNHDFGLIVLLPILVLLLSLSAWAKEPAAAAQIPVRCGGDDRGESHTVLLELTGSAHLSAPLKKLSLKSGQRGTFTVQADYPGNYRFSIRQTGEEKDSGWDRTIHTGELIVTEDEAGHMSAQVYLYRKSSGAKEDLVEFLNKGRETETEMQKPHGGQRPEEEHAAPDSLGEVRTGDSSHIGLYGILLLSAAAGIVVSIKIFAERKKHG